MSSQIASRMIDAAKMSLSRVLPDALIYSDVRQGPEAGNSPGFCMTLVAESTTNVLLTSEGIGLAGQTPEELADKVTQELFYKMSLLGCSDPTRQWMYFLFMVLCSEDVSTVKVSLPLTSFSIDLLKELKRFFGVTFKLEENLSERTATATCVGVGFSNMAIKSA